MAARSLRSGYTTGACAAAAAKGAALLLREQRPVPEVEIVLPTGSRALFELRGQRFDRMGARCFVIKDAGDDPDVTHGVEVHAEVTLRPPSPRPSPTRGEGEKEISPPLMGGGKAEGGSLVVITGGTGIGRVTKPGLAVPVGEWAINPVPRRMIEEAILEVFPPHSSLLTPHVTISIPDGEARAERTLNARLGIIGGLSILGTTGVVRPISHQAWTDTIEVAIDVALASGSGAVVLSTGRTSEGTAQAFFRHPEPGGRDRLPEEAFVMMGDHVGYALAACHRKGVARIVVSAQFAKLLKIACGHGQTHVNASRLDLGQLAGWARQTGLDGAFADRLECANTAREAWGLLGTGHPLVGEVAARALARLRQWAPGAAVALLLAGYDDRPPLHFGEGEDPGEERTP